MANSLGLVEGDTPGSLLPALPALPEIPGVPTLPVSVPIGPGSTTQLPSTPDGNVVAPVPASPPPNMTNPDLWKETPPTQSFWERHGDTITTGFAIVGVVAVASVILKGRSLCTCSRGVMGPFVGSARSPPIRVPFGLSSTATTPSS